MASCYGIKALLMASLFSGLCAQAGEMMPIGDVSLYVEDLGKGAPLILLHGGMGSADAWEYQIPDFVKHYRVIALDSRGQGRSTDAKRPISYHLMAEDVVKLMDKLNLNAAYIVGWSDGGNIGLDIAIHHSNRVKALVAYGANTVPNGLAPSFLEYLRTVAPAKMQRDNGSDYLRLSATPEHLPIVVEKIRKMWLTEPKFTENDLKLIKSPTLILDGKEEELIRPDHAQEIADAIPNATLVRLSHVGHYAMFDKTKEWNKVVLDFLKAH